MTDLELSTPATVLDLLGQAGFRAGLGTLGQVEDTSLGAGVQSLLMFHVLYMIDQGQFQGFGWKQAAIWAVEEPESALHRQLQVRLAALMRAYALQDDSRFQILMTTHNDVFVYGATSGFMVGLDGSLATVIQRRSIVDLAHDAATQQITSLPSPALRFPFETLVLTEGDIDSRVLNHAAKWLDISGILFVTPSQLDPAFGGDGIEAVKRFVHAHARSLSQRLSAHPLVVLVDWETSPGKVRDIAAKYGPGGAVNVRAMDDAWADRQIGDSFKGIERFYTVPFLERAENAGIVNLARARGNRLVITPQELGRAKSRLADLFCESTDPQDCVHLRSALEWVDSVRMGGMI